MQLSVYEVQRSGSSETGEVSPLFHGVITCKDEVLNHLSIVPGRGGAHSRRCPRPVLHCGARCPQVLAKRRALASDAKAAYRACAAVRRG